MVRDYGKYIIEKKKKLVLDIVNEVCGKIDLRALPVNFEGCPLEKGDHLAHIHTDTHVICISEHQLHKLNYDEIRHTVIHEISHVFAHGHGGDFQRTQANIGVATWEPPGGSVVIRGGAKSSRKKKTHTRKFNPNECSFYDCKQIKFLRVCEYCKSSFCTKHIRAKIPRIPHLSEDSARDLVEWREDGHGCPAFAMHEINKNRKTNDAYSRALDALRSKSIENNSKYRSETYTILPTQSEIWIRPNSNKKNEKETYNSGDLDSIVQEVLGKKPSELDSGAIYESLWLPTAVVGIGHYGIAAINILADLKPGNCELYAVDLYDEQPPLRNDVKTFFIKKKKSDSRDFRHILSNIVNLIKKTENEKEDIDVISKHSDYMRKQMSQKGFIYIIVDINDPATSFVPLTAKIAKENGFIAIGMIKNPPESADARKLFESFRNELDLILMVDKPVDPNLSEKIYSFLIASLNQVLFLPALINIEQSEVITLLHGKGRVGSISYSKIDKKHDAYRIANRDNGERKKTKIMVISGGGDMDLNNAIHLMESINKEKNDAFRWGAIQKRGHRNQFEIIRINIDDEK